MTARTQPPFRADHVGSFLRPKYLLDAREEFFVKKSITAQQLRAVEDKAIAEIVKFQQDVGLKSITDGEFRRTYFHIDFLDQLGGVKIQYSSEKLVDMFIDKTTQDNIKFGIFELSLTDKYDDDTRRRIPIDTGSDVLKALLIYL